jgi:hypothetical protein
MSGSALNRPDKRPYGTFELHLDRHLDLDPHPVSA